MTVNEKDSEIISCKCHDCAVSAGGCKHAVAFLMWSHCHSEELPCTLIECYWKKSTLSKVGTTLKYITVPQLCKKEVPHRPSLSSVYDDFISEAKKQKVDTCKLLKYQHDLKHTGVMQYSLHSFMTNQCQEFKINVNKLVEVMKATFTVSSLHCHCVKYN